MQSETISCDVLVAKSPINRIGDLKRDFDLLVDAFSDLNKTTAGEIPTVPKSVVN